MPYLPFQYALFKKCSIFFKIMKFVSFTVHIVKSHQYHHWAKNIQFVNNKEKHAITKAHPQKTTKRQQKHGSFLVVLKLTFILKGNNIQWINYSRVKTPPFAFHFRRVAKVFVFG